MVVPLLAGPCRIAAYSIWSYSQTSNGVTIDAGMIKAMLYVDYSISTTDDLMAYLVDLIVYGYTYPALGMSSTFTEINFFPSDIMCYLYNFYDDSTSAYYAVPSKYTGGLMEPNTMFYGVNNQASYPSQSDITTCGTAAGSNCYSYTCS